MFFGMQILKFKKTIFKQRTAWKAAWLRSIIVVEYYSLIISPAHMG